MSTVGTGAVARGHGEPELEMVQLREFIETISRLMDETRVRSGGALEVSREGGAGEAGEGGDPTERADRADRAEREAADLARRLVQLLDLQTLQARQVAVRGDSDQLTQTRYLKAALADEILLHSDWIGRERWTGHLLESRLFHSGAAGQQIFDRIDELLRERLPAQREWARLYLLGLATGFQGRYRGGSGRDALLRYRAALYEFGYGQALGAADGDDRVLAPDAHAHLLAEPPAPLRPPMSRWTAGLLLGLVAVLALSEVLWLWHSAPLRRALEGEEAVMGLDVTRGAGDGESRGTGAGLEADDSPTGARTW